jgi:hypothetical protein
MRLQMLGFILKLNAVTNRSSLPETIFYVASYKNAMLSLFSRLSYCFLISLCQRIRIYINIYDSMAV